MVKRKSPSLTGLQSATFDQNALGNNMALDRQGVARADDYYRGQEAQDFGNVQATAEDWRQHGAAIAPGDPTGMRAFMEGLKERNAVITPRSGFVGSHGSYPLETEYTRTFDPSFQSSAVEPASALATLSQKRKKK